jgi:hypothetical protein
MTADVLPAVLFKNYTFFASTNNEGYDEGLEFMDASGKYTVNYPKVHIKNGEAKNSPQQTNGHYKPAVRMFKNARNRAVERGFFRDGGTSVESGARASNGDAEHGRAGSHFERRPVSRSDWRQGAGQEWQVGAHQSQEHRLHTGCRPMTPSTGRP